MLEGTDLFAGEDKGSLPFMFLLAEKSNGDGNRQPGRETDVLTDGHHSDTD